MNLSASYLLNDDYFLFVLSQRDATQTLVSIVTTGLYKINYGVLLVSKTAENKFSKIDFVTGMCATSRR